MSLDELCDQISYLVGKGDLVLYGLILQALSCTCQLDVLRGRAYKGIPDREMFDSQNPNQSNSFHCQKPLPKMHFYHMIVVDSMTSKYSCPNPL